MIPTNVASSDPDADWCESCKLLTVEQVGFMSLFIIGCGDCGIIAILVYLNACPLSVFHEFPLVSRVFQPNNFLSPFQQSAE